MEEDQKALEGLFSVQSVVLRDDWEDLVLERERKKLEASKKFQEAVRIFLKIIS